MLQYPSDVYVSAMIKYLTVIGNVNITWFSFNCYCVLCHVSCDPTCGLKEVVADRKYLSSMNKKIFISVSELSHSTHTPPAGQCAGA